MSASGIDSLKSTENSDRETSTVLLRRLLVLHLSVPLAADAAVPYVLSTSPVNLFSSFWGASAQPPTTVFEVQVMLNLRPREREMALARL